MTSTPSTLHRLDGVPLGVSHRSIRSARSVRPTHWLIYAQVVIVGGEKHHRVAWGQSVPFSTASHVSLRLSGGGSASCSLAGLNAGDRRWLACSTRGHVLLEVRSSHAEEEDDDDDVVVPASHNPYELGAVWAVAQAVSRLLFAPQIAAVVAASSSCSLAAALHDPSLARPAALVAFASA